MLEEEVWIDVLERGGLREVECEGGTLAGGLAKCGMQVGDAG